MFDIQATEKTFHVTQSVVSSPLLAVGHETEKWSVFRRYLEFYVLESKLTEFHGKISFDLVFILHQLALSLSLYV